MTNKTVTRTEIEETISELYILNAFVITGAGIRLTYPVLRSFMKNPKKTLNEVEESSKVESNSSLARDIVEVACYLLVGSKDRKWLSVEDIVKELEKRGYTTTIGNDNALNSQETK